MSQQFSDIELTCKDCSNPFLFSAGQQEYFKDKGLSNKPKRCRTCKEERDARFDKIREPKPRVETVIDCATCGARALVPFEPVNGRPVYCRPCFVERARV